MRALLRRQIWRSLRSIHHQHNLPHKEYFQNPGQTPLPDAPYNPPPLAAFPSPPSYFRRALRSITWATLFGTLGVAGGISLLTWDYLQPPFEPGSEEDQELLEEIESIMDTHPLVQGLRDDGWTETPCGHPQSRILQVLSGTQGMILKGFTLPSAGYTILVFYTGNGLEGWPDIIHGGLITTLFDEAANLHNGGQYWSAPYQVVIDFKESIRPGEIYSILVPPSGWEESIDQQGRPVAMATHVGLLMRMEYPPEIVTEVDEVAKTKRDVVTIPTRGSNNSVFAQATFYFVGSPFNEDGTRIVPEGYTGAQASFDKKP
jgi:hypothetical protein